MNSDDFVVSVQIDPPATRKLNDFKRVMAILLASGVRIVDVNSSRRISHDSIQLAVALAQMGFITIPHVTTRDSSLNGLLNQIFAAYEWGGVRDFLFITGDPYEASQSITPSRGIFQTDSIGAIEACDKYLRKDLKLQLDLTFYAAVNQNEADLACEGERLKAKESAGADFFMSQPVFSKKQALCLFDFYEKHSKKPLLVGIWPLIHPKTISSIHEKRIVGVCLDDETWAQAARHTADQSKLQNWGLKRAYDLVEFICASKRAQGVYIVAPARNPLILLDTLREMLS